MAVSTQVPIEEYLRTSYSPDREYRDGAIVERNLGSRKHALLQSRLTSFISRRRRSWGVEVYTELRIRARQGWYPIPDVCVYEEPPPSAEVPTTLPLLWIEILSPDDRMLDVWAKAEELIACGCPNVWIIDPDSLASELWTPDGKQAVKDRVLRIPPAIEIPLAEALEE
jgi:Uma2 family endonuclease